MIRIRRTCSKPIFIWQMDKLLLRELTALGHKTGDQEMSKFKATIKMNYNDDMTKKDKEPETETEETKKVYGATTKVEAIGRTHQKVISILTETLGTSTANMPMLVPSTKLKEILTTRKRYLSKLNLNKNK